MHIVRVIPIVNLPPTAPSVLDYFWTHPLPPGSLVRIAMNRRTVQALVVESQDVRELKLSLKRSSFTLKRLSSVVSDLPQLTAEQMQLSRWISSHYACSPASTLKAVAPSFIGKRGALLDHSRVTATVPTPPTVPVVVVAQPDMAIARLQCIRRGGDGQMLILVPERTLARTLATNLPADTRIMHAALRAAEYRELYRGVLDGTVHTVIGTRSALFLPWNRLSHIVVEDASNEAYKSDATPRLNAPDVARQLAVLHGASLTLLTPALNVVQHYMIQQGTLQKVDDKPFWPSVTVASMERQRTEGQRSLFSREAVTAIVDCVERRAPLLIASARRGYATIARCTTCTKALLCTTCDAPLRWNRIGEDMLVCYHCASFYTPPTQCPACHAGTLRPAGIPGSQKLAEAVNVVLDRHGMPGLTIPILDSDLIRDDADEERILSAYDKMKQPVLIASVMIFSHRYTRRFDTVVIPHLDMLASSPDYRAQDRLVSQIEKFADFQPVKLIVQTYADEMLAAQIAGRRWSELMDAELTARKQLRWPPYARIVRLSLSHRDRRTAQRHAMVAADKLTRAVAHLEVSGARILGPSPALVERSGGQWTQHIVLKWPHSRVPLAQMLQYVPPGWTIDVDPRTIA